MKNKEKIDLVYTWVDGSDPSFVKEKEYWQNKLNIAVSDANCNNKYVDHEELRYSLRSVFKYAPWINRIFIVTNGQIPKWLDLSKTDKIKIITHKEIMPTDALPTFNSNAIESCLINIPDLSEHFIYANDDMYISRPVKPNFFFDRNGKPIIRFKKPLMQSDTTYHKQIKYTCDLFLKKYKKKYNYRPHHNMDTYLKSTCMECQNEFKNEFESVIHSKFRTIAIQRNVYSLYMLYRCKCKAKCVAPLNNYCIHRDSLVMRISDFKMLDCIMKATPNLVCFNDSIFVSDEDLSNYKSFLEFMFPWKQDFEKDEQIEGINYEVIKKYNELYKQYNFLWKVINNTKCIIENILSFKDEFYNNKHHTVLTIFGLKLKIKRKGKTYTS